MSKFNRIYLHLLFENSTSENMPYSKEAYEEFFFKDAVFFGPDGIIKESKDDLVDVPDELIKLCLRHSGSYVESEDVLNAMKYSKHWRNSVGHSVKKLFFDMFNFNNDLEIESFSMRFFKIDDNDELRELVKLFRDNVKHSIGFFKEAEEKDECLICIDSSSKNVKQTIYHELSHYVQAIGNVRLTKDTKEELTERKRKSIRLDEVLENVGASFDDIIYYFSSSEFSVHVDELVRGLKNTWSKFYGSKNPIMFYLEDVLPALRQCENFKNTEFFNNYVLANNSEYAALVMFLGSYVMKYKFQKIQSIIKTRLKNF